MQPAELDFVLAFCREMIPEHGEDSYCHSFCDNAGLIGVFDGCGGAGARTHSHYSGHTEAYMASRLCSGAFYDAFCATFPCDAPAGKVAQELFLPAALERLREHEPPKEEGSFVIKGSMVRTLPTTAAAALLQSGGPDQVVVSPIWAGDSRVFLLSAEGLAQLTVDDTSVPDPMDNLYDDGVLRNIFCSDREVILHHRSITVKTPFVVLAATDGCFGYVTTPMEFEGILLKALMKSQSPAQWEQKIADSIGAVAGDDHAMCLAAYGYGSLDALQKSLRQRYDWLQENYLKKLETLPLEDRETRYALWETYRGSYMRYLSGEEV